MNSNESSNTLGIPKEAWDNTDIGTQQIIIQIHAVGTEWTKDVAEGVIEVVLP